MCLVFYRARTLKKLWAIFLLTLFGFGHFINLNNGFSNVRHVCSDSNTWDCPFVT